MSIKEKAARIIEHRIMKSGFVLAVRAWNPATFYEIDLHLPYLDMDQWKSVKHIKCQVAPFTFRDYTISGWDAETRTCTLFIDATHEGAGSHWVQALRRGDLFYYLNVESSRQPPFENTRHLFLGDQSAIGHFFALQQIAGPTTYIRGAVLLKEALHREAFTSYFPDSPLEPLAIDGIPEVVLFRWLEWLGKNNEDVVYVAGGVCMAVELRKQLRRAGYAHIKVQGFWK